MTRIGEIYDFIDSFAPFESAMSFDNCGLLVGDREQKIEKALVALDITPETLSQAISFGAQLIVSHHPVIFHPLRALSPRDLPCRLLKEGIAAICAHTNLDLSAEFGVNTCLAAVLGIGNLKRMDPLPGGDAPQWFLGELPEAIEAREFASLVKSRLGALCVRYTEGAGKVQKIGLLSGAGADAIEAAARAGADAFLTGEIGHHEFLSAKTLGITAVEAGHFATEAVVVKPFCAKLAAHFPDVSFAAAQERDPAQPL